MILFQSNFPNKKHIEYIYFLCFDGRRWLQEVNAKDSTKKPAIGIERIRGRKAKQEEEEKRRERENGVRASRKQEGEKRRRNNATTLSAYFFQRVDSIQRREDCEIFGFFFF